MNARGVTLIGMGKAAATPTASGSATSAAGAAPAGGATAGVGAGVAAGGRAETESTEEVEVRAKVPCTRLRANNSTGEEAQESRSSIFGTDEEAGVLLVSEGQCGQLCMCISGDLTLAGVGPVTLKVTLLFQSSASCFKF